MPNLIPPAELEHKVSAVRDGIRWLYEAWMSFDLADIPDDEWDPFANRLRATDNLDKALRVVGGYSGCVWAPQACPVAGPMVCGGCAPTAGGAG